MMSTYSLDIGVPARRRLCMSIEMPVRRQQRITRTPFGLYPNSNALRVINYKPKRVAIRK